jgi:hypothetical protein
MPCWVHLRPLLAALCLVSPSIWLPRAECSSQDEQSSPFHKSVNQLERLGRTHFHIAVLLPEISQDVNFPFCQERVAPGLDIALEEVRRRKILSEKYELDVQYADSKCDTAHALNEAIEFYIHHTVDVFFGPCCDYTVAPVARQANYWKTPVITAGAMARDFRASAEKHSYPTLIRVGTNFNDFSDVVVGMLRGFNWTRAMLVYEPTAYNHTTEKLGHLVADALHNNMLMEKGKLSPFKHEYIKIVDSYTDFTTVMEQRLNRNFSMLE